MIHRRDAAIRGWRNWVREDPLVHPYRWLRPDLLPLAPFLQCDRSLTPDGSGVLSASLFLPFWAKGRPALTNSALRLMGGYRYFLRFNSLG